MKSLPLLLALCFALFLVSANDAAEDFSQPGFNSELIKVGKQYSLNTMKDVSTCFWSCHSSVVSLTTLPERDINFVMAVTLNCQYSEWVRLISNCMVQRCVSTPDYAYALEYGTRFCKRAGVDVSFDIPEWFPSTPGGVWYKATLASSTRPVTMPLGPTIVVVATAGAIALSLF